MATCHPRLLPRAIVACCPIVTNTGPTLAPAAAVAAVAAKGAHGAPQRRLCTGYSSPPQKWLEFRVRNSQNLSSSTISSSSSRLSSWNSSALLYSKTASLSRGLVGIASRGRDPASIVRYGSRRKCQIFAHFELSRKGGATGTLFHLQRTFCTSQSRDSGSMSSPQEQQLNPGSEEYFRGGKYCVFLTGYASDYTQNQYGGYAQMCVTLLKDPEETWDIYAVIDGQFPTEEELEKYDGFVITGSASDAHGSEDWIADLCALLQSLHKKRQKTLGVCFGHQVLSRALGGETGRGDVGWELGLRELEATSALGSKFYAQGLPSKFKILQSHRDQVKTLPPGATLLASSRKTGIEIFGVDDHILGIQGHPEFFDDVINEIIDRREALGAFTKEVAKEGRETLQAGKADREVLIQLCKKFLKGRKAD